MHKRLEVCVCVSLLKQRTKHSRESLGVRSSCSCHSNTAKNMGGRGGRWGDSWVMGMCVCVYACMGAWMYDYPPADRAQWCWAHQGPPCRSPSWGPDPNPAACNTHKCIFLFYPSNLNMVIIDLHLPLFISILFSDLL